MPDSKSKLGSKLHGKPPMADTWCPSVGPSGYGLFFNAPANASPQPQRAADLGEALRQQVESRIRKRFDKTKSIRSARPSVHCPKHTAI